MRPQRKSWAAHLVGVAAIAAGAISTHGQASDAIIDKLVEKGILTVKEANDLREESDKGYNQAYQVKGGMPDWISSLKINGDVRGRFEGFYTEEIADRLRYRYRLRLGMVATFREQFEVGLRLTSGEAPNTFGGDPISDNTTLTGNGSKKYVYLSQVYAKWTPINNQTAAMSFSLGKMENPFGWSDMLFDPDYSPEGLSQQFAFNLNDKHSLKLNMGEFALAEIGNSSNDPFLLGVQTRWDAAWTPKWSSSTGVGALWITDARNLRAYDYTMAGVADTYKANTPDVNYGNSRNPTYGYLSNGMQPIVAEGSLTYTVSSFPAYNGPFPIKVGGEYMNNLEADRMNEGYWVGVTFGKSGKKGTWDVSYRYKELQGDAWFEELVDSDFGAYYRQQPLGAGPSYFNDRTLYASGKYRSGGYYSGTNVRGHVVKAAYSPYDCMTLGVTYFLTETIEDPKVANSAPTHRIQVDAQWKF